MRWITGVALALALVACSSGTYDPNNSGEAKSQCQGFTDERLKAPASADYNLYATHVGNEWTVTGTVDSDNGFGAKVRSSVRCSLHFTASRAVLDDIAVN